MSEIIDKLTYLEGTKALLKSKLKAGDNVPFRDYPGLIQGPKEGSQAEYDIAFARANIRPSDWLPMPTFAEGEQKVALLVAVYDDDSEYVAFKAAGAYTVDWGDGSAAENFASGATAEHKYEFSTLASTSLCSEGYRQALMVVVPQSGNSLTGFALNMVNTVTHKAPNFLDVSASGPLLSSITTSNARLRRFSLIGANSIVSFASFFGNCISLSAVPHLNTTNGTDFSYMFYGCYALTAIPQLDTAKGTNFSNLFNGCLALTAVPQLDTSKGTNFNSMFSGCQALTAVPLLNTANGTNFNGMFQSCITLTTVPQIDTSNGTNFSYMFFSCFALTAIPLLDTAKGTDFSYMFFSCSALASVPLINTAKGTIFSYMFCCCFALTTIPQLDTSKGTGFSVMFNSCQNLSRMRATGFKVSFSLASCKLSRAELVSIFTGLPTVTGQTITVTGNFSAAQLTAEDKAIATTKGWTVTV